jgi:hypothetical protein
MPDGYERRVRELHGGGLLDLWVRTSVPTLAQEA